MGDVLGGLGRGLLDVLGGAYALKRQEKDGFDWREKDAQERFLRDQQREQARQQNEAAEAAQDERLQGQLVDVLQGAQEGEQPDLESMLPQNIEYLRRQRIIRGAVGAGKERKSALQAQRAATDLQREQMRQQGRMDVLSKTQEFQDAMQEERLAAAREGREASMENARKLAEMRISAGRSGGGRGGVGKWKPIPRMDLETGEEVLVDPVEAQRNPDRYASPLSAAQKDRQESAEAVPAAMDAARAAAQRFQATSGASKVGSLIPGVKNFTRAGVAWEDYTGQLKNAASRMAKSVEGSRLSDQDRIAYAEALATVNEAQAIAFPDEAIFDRLNRAEQTIQRIQQRIEQERRGRYRFRGPGAGGSGGPKVGDTKRFPNGRIGRWDGTGWKAVQ